MLKGTQIMTIKLDTVSLLKLFLLFTGTTFYSVYWRMDPNNGHTQPGAITNLIGATTPKIRKEAA
jgi:hypothetical protein